MERHTYGPKLHELTRTAQAFRLTVRMHRSNILACEAWQETPGSRGYYSEMQQIDRWYADSPLVVVRSMDDVQTLFAEATMSRRLPGID